MSASPQAIPYFGRAWQITITPQNGGPTVTLQSSPRTPSFQIEFAVEKVLLQPVWVARVTIYNLGSATSSAISGGSAVAGMSAAATSQPLGITQSLAMGDTVTIAAGYQSSASGTFSPTANLIYTGTLLQSISTRQNVTDSKLVLRCITNLAANAFAFSNFARPAGVSDWTVLNQALGDAGLDIENIDPGAQQILQNQTYSRGQAIYDRPLNVIDQIAKQHNLFYWTTENGLNLQTFSQPPSVADYAYGPPNLSSYTSGGTNSGVVKQTLIGYPEGTQEGVMFRVLLDSQVKIGNSVQIAPGTAINTFQFNYPGLPPLPNAQGIYFVTGIRHVGVTRGREDDWYTEITAMTPKFFSTYLQVYQPGSSQS